MALICIPIVGTAAVGDVITVRTSGGDKTFAVQDVQKVTFDTDGMRIATRADDEAEKILFSDVRSIVFEDIETGVASASAVSGKLRISSRGNCIVVMDGHYSGSVDIYTMAGVKALGIKALSGNEIDVSALPAGAYILKTGNATIKFYKQ